MNGKATFSWLPSGGRLAAAAALVLGVATLIYFAWPEAPPVPAPSAARPAFTPALSTTLLPAGPTTAAAAPTTLPSVAPAGVAALPSTSPAPSPAIPSYSTGRPNMAGTGALITGGVPLVPEFKPSAGTVTIGQRTVAVESVQNRYPRLEVEKLKPVDVALRFPADGSKAVLVSVNHGGRINGNKVTETFPLGADRTVRFSFTPSDQSGLFQVGLQRGTYLEAMEFWVRTGDARLDATVR